MHYSLIVIGNGSLRDMMAPFDQELEVDEYCVREVPVAERQRMVDFYNQHTPGSHYSLRAFDELYAERGYDWNINCWRKDKDGIWREYSTSNPNMKWDWYEVGGRWAGQLQIKDGVETEPIHFSWGWSAEDKRKVLDARPRRADIAQKRDIANLESLRAFSILKDGEWHDCEDTPGCDAMEVAPFLEDVSDDTLITYVDYHM